MLRLIPISMKRSLTALFALLLLIGAVTAFVSVAHAATDPAPPDPTLVTPTAPDVPEPVITNCTDTTCDVTLPPTAADKTPTSLNAPPADAGSYGQIMTYIMGLFAWLLGVAALTLDNVMYHTVVHMGTYINGLSAIGVAWRILRDVGNIVLIFGFLAIGICTILDVKWYGGGTKMLPTLLVAAVFLNFSLFISEAVIDAGNLFATEFYTQINGGNPSAAPDYSVENIHNEGISKDRKSVV